MLAYLAFAWDSHDPLASGSAKLVRRQILRGQTRWAMCFRRPGLCVLVPASVDERPPGISLRNGSGIILGTIFPSRTNLCAPATATVSFSELEETEISQTAGRSLIRSHWGSYVLLLQDRETATIHVMRGPMSAMPCFWLELSGLTVFCSRPADLVDLRIARFRVNWDHIRAQSLMGEHLCEETGLTGVYTMLSGDCMTLSGDTRARRVYWSPAYTGIDIPVSGMDSATDLLRRTTRAAIDSWCSLHESIIVSLSGGFDSSVVLACAATSESEPKTRALNLYSRNSGDERRYARSIAQMHSVPLKEVELPDTIDLSPFLNCARTASPVMHFTAFATESIFARTCAESGASAVFTGELGDCMFGHAYGPEVLAEALCRYRLTPHALRIIMDYAVLYRLSFWRSLRIGYSAYRRHSTSGYGGHYENQTDGDLPPGQALATADAIGRFEETRRQFRHPWLSDLQAGFPGYLPAIGGMIMLTSTWMHSGFSGVADSLLVAPLASQPVVEAFLSIPGDLHIAGAQSAAVARHAFHNLLSPEVLNRGKGKGSAEPWLDAVIRQNQGFIRDLLLDGILVRERILDRRKIEAALSGEIFRGSPRIPVLICQLYVESWLRRWMDPHLAASTIDDTLPYASGSGLQAKT